MIIRGSWKRTVQVKPYESEVFELAASGDFRLEVEDADGKIPVNHRMMAQVSAADVSRAITEALTKEGDKLLKDRYSMPSGRASQPNLNLKTAPPQRGESQPPGPDDSPF